MLKDIFYSFNKLDYFYYYFLSIIIFITINNSGILLIPPYITILSSIQSSGNSI